MMHPDSTRNCLHCGQPFTPNRPKQRWCNRSCAAKDYPRPTPEQRLWPQTDRTGPDFQDIGPCWRFTGSLVPDGYGTILVNGKRDSTHRVAWELTYGPIPDGTMVLHKCDVRNCISPLHLFLGTHRDNMDDMVEKGRAASGERLGINLHPERAARGDRNGSRLHPERLKRGTENPNAKLTEQDVRDMRRMRQEKITRNAIAAAIGVSRSTVDQVLDGRIWRHVQ